MSKIGWAVAGTVAAVTTVVVSIKLALEDTGTDEPRFRPQRETPTQKTQQAESHGVRSEHL